MEKDNVFEIFREFGSTTNELWLYQIGFFMVEIKKTQDHSGVDKVLVAMFIKMTPEERLKSNDNAARTILELRNAYQQQKSKNYRLKRNN